MAELMDLWQAVRDLHDYIRASFWLDAVTLAAVLLLMLQNLGLRASLRRIKRKVSNIGG